MSTNRKQVGTLVKISRFPVKSMAGEGLTEAKIGWHGIGEDRRYAFVIAGNITGFPWVSARVYPEIATYQPIFRTVEGRSEPALFVKTPTGEEFAIDDPALAEMLSQRSCQPCHLLHHFGGVFDCADLSIITTNTVNNLAEKSGTQPDDRRFRPNFVIQPMDDTPFPEDKWVGDVLIFGTTGDLARIRVNRKDSRCMVVSVDPDTGTQDPRLLKEIAGARKNLAGVYGTTERPGLIKVGDPVWL